MGRLQILFFTGLLLFSSCSENKTEKTQEAFECKIRLNRDPGRINPIFSPTSIGREVFQYIFLPLADFHPESLELIPILIEDIPTAKEIVKTDGDTLVAYDIKIRKDALWSDGERITNRDYEFIVKAIKHPNSKAIGWKPYFDFIKDVQPDSLDDKKLTVLMDKNYMLSKETAITICLMPNHVLDPEGSLSNISIERLNQKDFVDTDSSRIKVIENVNNTMNAKTNVVQTGPYVLKDYQTDLYIVLERQENYWGLKHENIPYLNAEPQKLIFSIVPDEVTAVSMAKESKLDILSMRQSQNFLELKNDDNVNSEWQFHVPQLMMFFYIAMNNKSSLLADKTLRKAMAHLADVDDYIENIDGGLGTRTTGYFHPTKSYYNDKLKQIPYDLQKAASLLDEAGWKDLDQDGIREKQISGKRQNLEFDFLITGSQLSRNLALLFQESAKKVGVKINIVIKKNALMQKENLSNFNYDMAALANSLDAAPDDPYSRWHSDNAVAGKRNQIGYINAESDKLIEKIRTTRDEEKRKEYYIELQELMYEDQPAVFLYSPLQKIMISKRLKATTTSKRPGYMANTFTLADS